MPAPLTFPATIQIRGINPYVLVSAARARTLMPAWRKPLPALLRVNGNPAVWQVNLMPTGTGSFYLYLHAQIRTATGTAVGDRIRAHLRFNPHYRNGPQHPLPRWFSAALQQNPPARHNWKALTPSRKKEILRYFAHLKSPQAHTRNLQKALQALSGTPTRFMARSWNHGT